MGLLLLVYLIAEGAAVWAVSAAIGVLPAIALLIAGVVLGSALARREGGKAVQAFLAAARAGKPAHTEITDGMLVALGGFLIMLPGFVSDVFGLLLLLPPTRAVFRRAWLRRLERRAPLAFTTPAGPQQENQVIVVDSEVVTEDPPKPAGKSRPVIDGN